MENIENSVLNLTLQIDEQVTTCDQIQPGEGRVAQNTVMGEQDRVAYLAPHAVMVSFLRKKTRQSLGADICFDGCGIQALTRISYGILVQVGSKNLNLRGHLQLVECLKEQH